MCTWKRIKKLWAIQEFKFGMSRNKELNRVRKIG